MFGMGTGGSSLPSSPLLLYILCFHSIHTFLLRKIYNYIAISYKRLLLFFFEPRKNHRNFCEKFSCTLSLFKRSSPRPISIGQLLHYCIYTSDLSTLLSARGLTNFRYGIPYLEASFTLRCFQRLSQPHSATLPCRWRDNRCTVGAFIPVLSY